LAGVERSSHQETLLRCARLAATLTRLTVEGVDDGLLSVEHAMYLRQLGSLALDEEIDWS
jgi:hypothetical protein